MPISSIYSEYIKGNIIKEFLVSGVIPTKNQIEEKVEELIASNQNLDKPFLTEDIYKIDESESSSVSKINRATEILKDDLSVLYSSLNTQAKNITSTYDTVSSEIKSIEKRVKILENKVGNLLILSKNIEGYLDYVSDNFTNKEKVNGSLSDIFIDNSTGVVTLPVLEHTRIPLALSDSDIQFNVITREQLQSVTLAPGSSKLNAFNNEESIWLQRVALTRGVGSVTTELIFRLPNANNSISKLTLMPATSDSGNITTATIQYSNDGLNWINPDGDATLKMIGQTTFFFSPIKASYWKIVMNKAGYDQFIGGSYLYEFGLQSIKLYAVDYLFKENKLQGTLYSKALKGEKDAEFNRVSLKVCEKIPDNTVINYYLAALTEVDYSDYESGILDIANLNFIPIDPIDREVKVNESIINFAKLDPLTGMGTEYYADDSISFRYKNIYSRMLNYAIPSNIVKEEIKILRNTGDNSLDSGGSKPVTVNGVDNGWSFDGRFYSCEFYISEDAGRTIDLGKNGAEINDRIINGKTFLAKGFYKFKTDKQNWRTIQPADVASASDANPDILYPYNHKYLIEGLGDTLYGTDLEENLGGKLRREIIDPDGVYNPVARYWEVTMGEVSAFDFTSNIENDNFTVFALSKDYSGIERIVVKHNPEPGLLDNEKLAIITRAINSDLYKAIILKAEMTSEDSKVTPILDEYLIRLGY